MKKYIVTSALALILGGSVLTYFQMNNKIKTTYEFQSLDEERPLEKINPVNEKSAVIPAPITPPPVEKVVVKPAVPKVAGITTAAPSTSGATLEETQVSVDQAHIRLNEQEASLNDIQEEVNDLNNRVTAIEQTPHPPSLVPAPLPTPTPEPTPPPPQPTSVNKNLLNCWITNSGDTTYTQKLFCNNWFEKELVKITKISVHVYVSNMLTPEIVKVYSGYSNSATNSIEVKTDINLPTEKDVIIDSNIILNNNTENTLAMRVSGSQHLNEIKEVTFMVNGEITVMEFEWQQSSQRYVKK